MGSRFAVPLVFACLAGCGLFADADSLSRGSPPAPEPPEASTDASTPDVVAPTIDAAPVDTGTDAPRASYRDTVVSDMPIAYYRFDEAGGTVAKDEMGKHPGTYVGAVEFRAPGLVASDANPGIKLGSAPGCVSLGNTIDFTGKSPFTLEIWVRYTAIDGNYRFLFHKNFYDAAGRENFGVHAQDPDALSFERYVSNVGLAARSGLKPIGEVVHVVSVYTGAELQLYANGVLRGQAQDDRLSPAKTSELAVGCGGETTGTTMGIIDEAAIYDRALTFERIIAHYRAAGL
jgi:hypothetical protein